MNLSRWFPVVMGTIWVLGTLALWGLAFYPTGANSPEWIAVARSVCFGTLEDGLPNPGGWILLIFTPISFLAVSFVAWAQEMKSLVRSLVFSKKGRVALLLVLISFSVEASWVVKKLRFSAEASRINLGTQMPQDLPELYPRTENEIPATNLVDQSGEEFHFADYKGETILLTFAFAHCATICPLLVRQMLNTQEKHEKTRVVVITLDPWRDTPKSLPFLADQWDMPEDAHILSGAIKDVTAVLDQFKVPYERDEKTGDVSHPALVYIIDPNGKIAYTFNNAPDRWLGQAIERIKQNEKTSTTL